jgi:alkylation response protein AidB-like acyl-CoA dehydrogenase
MRSPGIEVRPLRQATGQAHFNEVFFNEVRIPAENVVGEVNGGWAVTRTVLTSEAGMIGSGGGGPASFANLLATARAFGRADDPVVRQGLADVWSRERMMQWSGMRMQTFVMHGRGNPPDPSVMKNFLTQSNEKKVNLGVALEGAAGMLDKADGFEGALWQTSLLGQFASRIGGGTNEVHRNMIAERALGLPRDAQPDKDLPWREILKA